jgi:hypothetical protein
VNTEAVLLPSNALSGGALLQLSDLPLDQYAILDRLSGQTLCPPADNTARIQRNSRISCKIIIMQSKSYRLAESGLLAMRWLRRAPHLRGLAASTGGNPPPLLLHAC